MGNIDFSNNIASYIGKLQHTLDTIDKNEINTLLNILIEAYNEDRNIFVMGNGGSAATASHFACDINKGIAFGFKKRFKVIALTDNPVTMMAYANDMSYDDIFVEQMKNFFNPGDVVICISGSGNSKNIVKATEYANLNDGVTVGLTGYNGGVLKHISKFSVNANVDDMQLSEDVHMAVVHIIMQALESELK